MPNKLGGVAAALQGLPGSVDARAAGVFGSVLAAYVLLYTAYSKQSKKLSLRQLLDVILVRVSLDNTLVELNKAVSLAGLTCLAFAYCPYVPARGALFEISVGSLVVHSVYSVFKFYGDKHIPKIQTFPKMLLELTSGKTADRAVGIKKLSVILGSSGLNLGIALALGFTATQAAGLASLLLGFMHFYSMEVDYKLKLGVRPFAYLAVAAPIVGLCYGEALYYMGTTL